MTAQIVFLVYFALELIVSAVLHGKERKVNKVSFWRTLLIIIFYLILLFNGGFFDVLLK